MHIGTSKTNIALHVNNGYVFFCFGGKMFLNVLQSFTVLSLHSKKQFYHTPFYIHMSMVIANEKSRDMHMAGLSSPMVIANEMSRDMQMAGLTSPQLRKKNVVYEKKLAAQEICYVKLSIRTVETLFTNGDNHGVTYTKFHWSECDLYLLVPVLSLIAKWNSFDCLYRSNFVSINVSVGSPWMSQYFPPT